MTPQLEFPVGSSQTIWNMTRYGFRYHRSGGEASVIGQQNIHSSRSIPIQEEFPYKYVRRISSNSNPTEQPSQPSQPTEVSLNSVARDIKSMTDLKTRSISSSLLLQEQLANGDFSPSSVEGEETISDEVDSAVGWVLLSHLPGSEWSGPRWEDGSEGEEQM